MRKSSDRTVRAHTLPLIGLILLLVAAPASAQAYQCQLPRGPVTVPQALPDGPTRQGTVEGYTLALSWSPEYCRLRSANAADGVQCGGKNGRFGLVLHGLWPVGKDGARRQWCPTTRRPSPELVRRNLCLTPSASLIAHEWAKHGSCMTKTPEAYFKAARILFDSLTLPDLDLLSRRKDLTAGAIREGFAAAFPAFKPHMVGINLSERGWLDEIRLCYGKDFRPARCTKAQYGPPDTVPAKIWRGL
jgi:ribonuclease T2